MININKNIIYKNIRSKYHTIKRIITKKYNVYNQFPEKNIFHKNVKLFNTSWGRGGAVNVNCEISNAAIGNYCQIGENVIIGARNHIHTNFTISDFIYSPDEFIQFKSSGMFSGYYNKVGPNVWIGRNVIINQGVEVGDNSIIGAGSVVVKSVPPYAIVGGNPVKLIRYKFNDEVISKLEETKWYLKDEETIKEMRTQLEDIVKFSIDIYKEKYWKTPKPFIKE